MDKQGNCIEKKVFVFNPCRFNSSVNIFANVPAWKKRKLVVCTKMYKTIVPHRDVCMLALANMKAVEKCHESLVLVAISRRCKAEIHDVMAAILVFQNNETAAMFDR